MSPSRSSASTSTTQRNRYGYPPDRQERAVPLVIKQAELLAGTA